MVLIAGLAVVAFCGAARAEQPQLPDGTAVVEDLNAGAVTVSVTAGAVATLNGTGDSVITPTGYIEVEGPVPLGRTHTPFRVYTRLGITSLPGETLDLEGVDTWDAGEVGLGAHRVVGRRKIGVQEVLTSIAIEGGFSSRLGSPEPRDRFARHYGLGIRFSELRTGSSITLLYGRDQAAGDRGFGQIVIYGHVPLLGNGAITVVGDATVSVGPRREGWTQRDVLRLGLVSDIGAVVDAFRGRGGSP
jgi:hypothetical protein